MPDTDLLDDSMEQLNPILDRAKDVLRDQFTDVDFQKADDTKVLKTLKSTLSTAKERKIDSTTLLTILLEAIALEALRRIYLNQPQISQQEIGNYFSIFERLKEIFEEIFKERKKK